MDPSNLGGLRDEPIKVTFLRYEPINIMLLTVWNHQYYVVYSMDLSILCCLLYGPINRMLFTVWFCCFLCHDTICVITYALCN